MENELRRHLDLCLASYVAATRQRPATVAQAAAGDWRFFDRIQTKTFTLKKYDAVMAWFSQNWPEATDWPEGILRPAPIEVAA